MAGFPGPVPEPPENGVLLTKNPGVNGNVLPEKKGQNRPVGDLATAAQMGHQIGQMGIPSVPHFLGHGLHLAGGGAADAGVVFQGPADGGAGDSKRAGNFLQGDLPLVCRTV